MNQIEKDRFFTMAETYDKMAQMLVPQYDMLQNEVFNIVNFPSEKKLVVLDLGAGSGIFLEKVLETYPNAICYWIDFSFDFMKVAQKRLAKFENRVRYILSPFENNWEEQLDHQPDLIFSMSAIHHLMSDEKKALYTKCFNLLKNEGWFFNADEMKTLNKRPYKNSLEYWAKYVSSIKENVPSDLQPFYDKWNLHFSNWKQRNIDNFGQPKYKGDDMHENFINQLNWLSEIGFMNEDVFLKFHLWTLIGGQKQNKNK